MKGRIILVFCAALVAVCLWPVSRASAFVDIELSFDPDTVVAGNKVIASASIANLADVREKVVLTLSVSGWGFTFGPRSKSIWLNPYESHSGWQQHQVPRCFPPGIYVFTGTATAHDGTDTEVTTLTILPAVPPCNLWSVQFDSNLWMDIVLSGILELYGGMPSPIENSTWGKIKTLF